MISKITLDKKDYLCISTENIPPQYRENASTSFYIKKIDGIRKWLESELLTNLLALDFEYTIQCIRKDAEETDLIVSAQSMNINGGAKATLDSTSSQVLILPILDEIKNLLEDNSELFKESQEGYKILNDYIDELEKESELPWVTLSFNKKTQVKFLFEVSTRKDYTLLNYYSGDYIKRQGREEMKMLQKPYYQDIIHSVISSQEVSNKKELEKALIDSLKKGKLFTRVSIRDGLIFL